MFHLDHNFIKVPTTCFLHNTRIILFIIFLFLLAFFFQTSTFSPTQSYTSMFQTHLNYLVQLSVDCTAFLNYFCIKASFRVITKVLCTILLQHLYKNSIKLQLSVVFFIASLFVLFLLSMRPCFKGPIEVRISGRFFLLQLASFIFIF